jgi:hypothetical protein
MPSAEEHQERADHNAAFLATIDTDEFADWAAVVAFYAAMHLIEKLRAYLGQHSEKHADRGKFILDRPEFASLDFPYNQLFTYALKARYQAGPHHWLRPDNIFAHLEVIQEFVANYELPK